MAVQDEISKREINVAAEDLRSIEDQFESDPPKSYKQKESVLNEYSDQFSKENVMGLTEDKFREFLDFDNNKHWTGLHRKQEMMTQNMELLRDNLSNLVNQSKSLSSRVQAVKNNVDGLGKATLSAILLTSDPTEYGVWNNRSEEALKQLSIWPEFERGASFGEKYKKVNDVLQRLGTELEMDMWALDARLGFYLKNGTTEDSQPSDLGAEFAKEKHLKEYLISHWEQTAIGKDWDIYGDSEDSQAGVEFSTGIGRLDLLLIHSGDDRVRVIELKRSRTSDKAVGQIMRYIGWVRKNLDELEGVREDSSVDGIIIGSSFSKKFRHAVSANSDIEMLQYELEVNLTPPDGTGDQLDALTTTTN
jgi:hypothetical protein